MMTVTRVETIAPITRREAEALARTEYTRVAELLRSLDGADWSTPTDCELWDVRAMAGHSAGMMSDFTSFRSVFGRMWAASKAAKAAGVTKVAFDRAGFMYHGRVKALADAAREAGLEF